MKDSGLALREELERILEMWSKTGVPTRSGFESAAKELIAWREENDIPGLWADSPLFMTATLDDGWGHGLSLIHLYAEVVGLQIEQIGLLQSAEKIVSECHATPPDILGLTVLQFDTEDDLIRVTDSLPLKTIVIAGGPVFAADPDFAQRSGIHYVARNAAHFLKLMLKIKTF